MTVGKKEKMGKILANLFWVSIFIAVDYRMDFKLSKLFLWALAFWAPFIIIIFFLQYRQEKKEKRQEKIILSSTWPFSVLH
jgi:hypothetical protein